MTTPNAELAYKVLDHIDAHPEQWDQGMWIGEQECGTVACFAGWTVLLSDVSVRAEFALIDGEEIHIAAAAEALLGIEDLDPDATPDPFDGLLTRNELGERIAEIFGPRPEHCGYGLDHPAHDWTKLANDERPDDQDARCSGGAE